MGAKRALNVIFVTGWRSVPQRLFAKQDYGADYNDIAALVSNGKPQYTEGLILNRVWFPCNTSKRTVIELLTKLHEVSKPENLSGNIINVLVGHSNGAKVIYKALQPESMRDFQKNYGRQGASIPDILKHTAVITLGGIQHIPKSLAEEVLALRLRDDIVSINGTKLYSENVNSEAVEKVVEIPCNIKCDCPKRKDKQLHKGKAESRILLYLEIGLVTLAKEVKKHHHVETSIGDAKHETEDYMECKKFRKEITHFRSKLGIKCTS